MIHSLDIQSFITFSFKIQCDLKKREVNIQWESPNQQAGKETYESREAGN